VRARRATITATGASRSSAPAALRWSRAEDPFARVACAHRARVACARVACARRARVACARRARVACARRARDRGARGPVADPRDRPLGRGPAHHRGHGRTRQRAAADPDRRLHPRQRVRRRRDRLGAGADGSGTGRPAVARGGDEPRRQRRRLQAERPRGRPQPQLPLSLAADRRRDLRQRPTPALGARDARRGRADPSHPASGHDLVPPARGRRGPERRRRSRRRATLRPARPHARDVPSVHPRERRGVVEPRAPGNDGVRRRAAGGADRRRRAGRSARGGPGDGARRARRRADGLRAQARRRDRGRRASAAGPMVAGAVCRRRDRPGDAATSGRHHPPPTGWPYPEDSRCPAGQDRRRGGVFRS